MTEKELIDSMIDRGLSHGFIQMTLNQIEQQEKNFKIQNRKQHKDVK